MLISHLSVVALLLHGTLTEQPPSISQMFSKHTNISLNKQTSCSLQSCSIATKVKISKKPTLSDGWTKRYTENSVVLIRKWLISTEIEQFWGKHSQKQLFGDFWIRMFLSKNGQFRLITNFSDFSKKFWQKNNNFFRQEKIRKTTQRKNHQSIKSCFDE